MNFPWYIAKRYVRAKSSQNAVNVINFITFLVIVIGSAALFIVLSGFAGLKTFSLSFSETFDPALKAEPLSGKYFSLTGEQKEGLHAIPGIAAYSAELEERVYLTHQQKSHVAWIKGVDSAYARATRIDSALYWGQWAIDNQQGVVGLGIANMLGLVINDYRNPLIVLAPKPGKGSPALQAKPYNQLALVIAGVYAVEENLDRKYLMTELPLVQALLERQPDEISGINFEITPETDMDFIRQQISAVLGPQVVLKDREEQNSTLYRMLNTENLATYLIFTLVLIIALFNVVGAIIMMILDKQQNSRTLYSLGTTVREIRRIYFLQGVIVTGMGGLLGVFLASLLIWSQLLFGWLKITPSLAYPVEYKAVNVFIVLGTILVLGVIAAKIASSRVNAKLLSA
jgi:lipoprotein-releasing system permease protein